jgi:hypothetical protein
VLRRGNFLLDLELRLRRNIPAIIVVGERYPRTTNSRRYSPFAIHNNVIDVLEWLRPAGPVGFRPYPRTELIDEKAVVSDSLSFVDIISGSSGRFHAFLRRRPVLILFAFNTTFLLALFYRCPFVLCLFRDELNLVDERFGELMALMRKGGLVVTSIEELKDRHRDLAFGSTDQFYDDNLSELLERVRELYVQGFVGRCDSIKELVGVWHE